MVTRTSRVITRPALMKPEHRRQHYEGKSRWRPRSHVTGWTGTGPTGTRSDSPISPPPRITKHFSGSLMPSQMSCWSTVRTSQLENPGSVSLRDLLPTLSAFCPIRWSITSSDIAMRQPLADAWYRPGSTLGRPAVVVDYEFQ